MSDSTAVVVIPIYRAEPDAVERASLERCRSVLGSHPIRLVCPESLDVSTYVPTTEGVETERFPDACFASIGTYSRLLCSADFYARFGAFDYMLVHQLDCYVFDDRLAEWCDADWDYIGAPWIDFDWLADSRHAWSQRCGMARLLRRVGNGGFSLRRVAAFRRVAHRLRWLASRVHLHEDLFWSNLAPLLAPGFRVASERDALRFAFEQEPRRCFERSGGLPFGCHGFARHDPSFWREHLAPAHRGVLAT